jgi:2-polyprenyl-3-methyl-5-hydroxy-6-metoxy-1,4-benzoquinol methylase
MLIESFPSFKYFEKYISCNIKTKILDFGCNWGNFVDSNPYVVALRMHIKFNAETSRFKTSNYVGVDVDREALEKGRELFPDATWIWYNRYNPVYNPTGEKVFPQLDQKFDLIVSYSVFTHMSTEDMLETLDYLYDQLNPGGTICFSYCNIDNPVCVSWFRERRENCDLIESTDYVYLINNKTSLEPPTEQVRHFVAFYKTEFLLRKLSKFNARSEPPHNVWFQDAIIIQK